MKGLNKRVNKLVKRLSFINYGKEYSVVLSTKLKKNLVAYKDDELWFNKQYLLKNPSKVELFCIYAVFAIKKKQKYCGWSDLI